MWEGLGLVDFSLVPHYRSSHPEAPSAEKLARHFVRHGIAHRALRDGEAIVWTGARAMLPAELRSIA
ncbi:hypothetical protein D3C83_240000 [compost metagenome]